MGAGGGFAAYIWGDARKSLGERVSRLGFLSSTT